jgi:hypothetical protein
MNKNLLSKENKISKENNYILYEIDLYSQQDNIKILEVWLKYFLDKPIKLIIKYIYEKEDIITLFKEKINVHKLLDNNIYFYKNIIVFKDDKFLNKYKKDIKLVFLNHSNFSIVYDLYIHILNQKYIITINNDITRELLDKSQLYDKFDEINIYNILNNYFNLNSNIHMNTMNLSKQSGDKELFSGVKTKENTMNLSKQIGDNELFSGVKTKENTIKNNKNKLEDKIKKTNIELSNFFKNLHF